MSRRPAWLVAAVGFSVALWFMSSVSLPTATGQPKPLVVPPAPQAPTLTSPANLGVKRGSTTELVLTGSNLAEPTAVLASGPGKITLVPEAKPDAAKVRIKVDVPADAPIGLYTLRVATKNGMSNLRPFTIDELPEIAEVDSNRTKEAARTVTAPCVIAGRTDPEASDYFKVKVAAGQKLTFEVLARRIGSPLDPIIVLHDGKTKRELVELYADDTPGLQSDCRLTHTFKEAGDILVEVRDTTYRGGADFFYRLRIGEFPGATTAFPLAVQRGSESKIGFAGPDTESLAPVAIKAPKDATLRALYVAPKGTAGISGWPLPVRLSDDPELLEQEPNDDDAKANKLPVPGGISARFATKADSDRFRITGKKGQKLTINAMAFELNAPTEVLIRVLDTKGAEVARSNPAQPGAKAEFTPAADGDFIIACEHTNYLSGPNEIYHLSVRPATPDFDVSLALDRFEAGAGSGTAIPVTSVVRSNGFAGPIELSVVGDPGLSGSVTVPNGQTQSAVPLIVKAGTKPGAYAFRIQAKATIDGKEVIRFATITDQVKASLGGMPNPPLEILETCAVAVLEKPAFTVTMTLDPEKPEKGKPAKLKFEVVRGPGADADIALAPVVLPAGVTAALKPIPKGATKAEAALTVPANAQSGALTLRATTKIGGKDHSVIVLPVVLELAEPKKAEPKKEAPKKK